MKLGDLFIVLDMNTTKFAKSSKQAYIRYKTDLADAVKKNPVQLRETGGQNILKRFAQISGAYLVLRKSINDFREFQSSIADVSTLTDQSLEQLESTVKRIGNNVPVELNNIAEGYYEVISATVDLENQERVLEQSARAGVAGRASTVESLKLASAFVKGYGQDWADVDVIFDKSFKTVELGQTNFGALAANLQSTIPLFSAFKISADELFGSVATLTGVTGNTSEVSTQLASIAASLAEPTAELNELIKEQTGLTVEQATAELGLAGILKIVGEATQGSGAEMFKYFKRKEAVIAATALAGNQFDTFIEKTNQVANATGSMTAAFDKQTKTLDRRLIALQNDFQVLTGDILKGLVPAGEAVINVVSSWLEAWNLLDESTKKAIITFGVASIVLLKLPKLIMAVRRAMLLLQTTMGFWAAIAIAIGAALPLIIDWVKGADDAKTKNDELAKSNEKLADSFEVLKKSFSGLSLEQLADEQEISATRIVRQLTKLKELQSELNNPEANQNRVKAAIEYYDKLLAVERKREKEITDLIEKRKLELEESQTGLTEKQQKELDKRKAYEFKSNRISLGEYIDYLESRQDAIKRELGEESAAWLKFVDELNALKRQANSDPVVIDTKTIDRAEPGQDTSEKDKLEAQKVGYLELQDVATDYSQFIHEEIDSEYAHRSTMLDLQLDNARIIYGEQSKEHQAALKKRSENDKKYSQAKKTLEDVGAVAAIDAIANIANAAQGTNETLFEIGKAASTAKAIINTYESATLALATYPPPFGQIAAAANITFGLLQVATIQDQKFRPKGKATGGEITANDIAYSSLTPSGEHGIIGVRLHETIMNEGATRLFREDLAHMNRIGLGQSVPGYATGGEITQVSTSDNDGLDAAFMGAIIEDAIIEGFKQSKLKVTGEFTASGKNLKSALDKNTELKERV